MSFQLGSFVLVIDRSCRFKNRSGPFSKMSVQAQNTLIIVLIAYAIPLFAQPLSQPAEGFTCGPSNLTCGRWGFVACLSPDGNYYCMPCYDEYLESLCGTKDEVQGCNLFCTNLSVDRETKRMQAEFDEKIADLRKIFTNKRLQLYVFVSVPVLIIVVFFIIWLKNCHKRDLNVKDCEQNGELEPLNRCCAAAAEQEKINCNRNLLDKEVQTDNTEVIQAEDQQQPASEEQVDCQGDNCPGYAKMQNVNPTNEAGDDKNKLAVTEMTMSVLKIYN